MVVFYEQPHVRGSALAFGTPSPYYRTRRTFLYLLLLLSALVTERIELPAYAPPRCAPTARVRAEPCSNGACNGVFTANRRSIALSLGRSSALW